MWRAATAQCICMLLMCQCAAWMFASDHAYVKGTVLSAEPYRPNRPRHLKRTDAPTPSTESDYYVTIRVNCEVYVGRYKSPDDYLPTVFAKGQIVDASVSKHLLYVKVPSGGDVKMGIADKHEEANCSSQ